MTKYEPHPFSLIWPVVVGEDFRLLVEDIKANGIRRKPTLFRERGRDWLLDGKLRVRAAAEAGITPKFEYYEGDDPLGFLISANDRRRHLNDSQRMMIAARLATLPQGRPKKTATSSGLSQSQASHLQDVSVAGVRLAKNVIERGTPELVAAVDQGEVTVKAAAEIAKLGKRAQAERLTKALAGGNVREPKLEDSRLSLSVRLSDNDVVLLRALAELGAESRNERARGGVVVLRRIVPAIGARPRG